MGLFRRAEPSDGAAASLEATALVAGASELDTDDAPSGVGRRDRQVDAGSDVVAEALGAKVLHGWLQNRHQTLMPLSLNLSILDGRQRSALAGILASLLLAGRPTREAGEFAPVLRQWLHGLGADAETLLSFDGAMDAPLPLNVLFDMAQARDLTTYAFVGALMASDPRYAASMMLPDLLQARFDLPSAIVRSAVRRYRR